MKGKKVMDVDKEIDLEFEDMMASKIERGPKMDWSKEELEIEKIGYRRRLERHNKGGIERYLKFMKACRAEYGMKRRKIQEVLSMSREDLEAKRQFQVVQEQANQYAMMTLAGIKEEVEYEVVEAWSSVPFRDKPRHLPGQFVHVNLRAKARSALSTDEEPSQQKLFFAELLFADREKEPEIRSMFELPDSSYSSSSSSSSGEEEGEEGHGDSDVAIVRGCRICPRGATRPIYHLVGHFCGGVPFKCSYI